MPGLNLTPAEEAVSFKRYIPSDSYSGPAVSGDDVPTITTGIVEAGFNEIYGLTGNALPAIWPVESFGKMKTSANTWAALTANPAVATVTTDRMMCDHTEFVFFGVGTPFQADIFINRKPAGTVTFANSTGYAGYSFTKLVFPSVGPRLIEIRTIGGIASVYTKKPGRIWKPSPDPNPTIAVVGDSYVVPSVMSDTAAGAATGGDPYLRGMWQRMPALLGIPHLVTDGMGGTGYIATGGSGMNYRHATRMQWLLDVNADVDVIHGGGINDLYGGNSVNAIIEAAIEHLENIHAAKPDKKLVFMEGFSPPAFSPVATYNTNYRLIREGVQAACPFAYYIDIATTRPPLAGTGYVTAANASGNSDVMVGSDAAHYTVRGGTFLRGVVAGKMRRVLADDGRLLGQLIL